MLVLNLLRPTTMTNQKDLHHTSLCMNVIIKDQRYKKIKNYIHKKKKNEIICNKAYFIQGNKITFTYVKANHFNKFLYVLPFFFCFNLPTCVYISMSCSLLFIIFTSFQLIISTYSTT